MYIYIYIYIYIYTHIYRCCPTPLTELVQLTTFGRARLDLAFRSTQPRRASTRLDRLSLDELRRGLIEPASTSSDEARSTQPRRAPARLGRASLSELRRGSIHSASASFDKARSSGLRRPLMTLDQQGFDVPPCRKTFSLSIMSSSFVLERSGSIDRSCLTSSIYIYTYNAVSALTGAPGSFLYFGSLALPKPLMLVRRARANPSSTCKLACKCSLTCFCTPNPCAKSDLHVQTGRFDTILAVSGRIWSGPKCSAHRQERVAEHF